MCLCDLNVETQIQIQRLRERRKQGIMLHSGHVGRRRTGKTSRYSDLAVPTCYSKMVKDFYIMNSSFCELIFAAMLGSFCWHSCWSLEKPEPSENSPTQGEFSHSAARSYGRTTWHERSIKPSCLSCNTVSQSTKWKTSSGQQRFPNRVSSQVSKNTADRRRPPLRAAQDGAETFLWLFMFVFSQTKGTKRSIFLASIPPWYYCINVLCQILEDWQQNLMFAIKVYDDLNIFTGGETSAHEATSCFGHRKKKHTVKHSL